ncbi:MAG: hypothetical protein UT86_C0003G0047 [Candidatus Magasanikbacteria bacterium GW2011_GWC2_40_17]|uniref:Uncharacterized protein n=1 Tax=Candidatus Magasanikbacteria bacterium GW2011_GWA2_42_32 TaxID=1619039 RepID=A0A0G1A7F1_9BACT|nr:MAG: hypothetical protein UT86_C0003G0047 [Candidatus Magasanikbacteria bacterium GW2011_GWC2_40_17]KKS56950.1 MAG: hypothetical protein UV20_C0004G0046 [Candidatus Magasanikbacteria bacterium GW2011_GWA2_42_32]OGH85482.1 MAG: hypothetical protein A2294_03045 [Candidatus Magasanikbacteria bacterium RIFOXYB2_FULL_38_10]
MIISEESPIQGDGEIRNSLVRAQLFVELVSLLSQNPDKGLPIEAFDKVPNFHQCGGRKAVSNLLTLPFIWDWIEKKKLRNRPHLYFITKEKADLFGRLARAEEEQLHLLVKKQGWGIALFKEITVPEMITLLEVNLIPMEFGGSLCQIENDHHKAEILESSEEILAEPDVNLLEIESTLASLRASVLILDKRLVALEANAKKRRTQATGKIKDILHDFDLTDQDEFLMALATDND